MTQPDQITKLFRNYFTTNDFMIGGKAIAFQYTIEKDCVVMKNEEPIWSLYLEDGDTKIMIIADAPSHGSKKATEKGGLGPHIEGIFKSIYKGGLTLEFLN